MGIPQRDTVPCYSPTFPALKSNLFAVTKPGQSLEEQLGCGERVRAGRYGLCWGSSVCPGLGWRRQEGASFQPGMLTFT